MLIQQATTELEAENYPRTLSLLTSMAHVQMDCGTADDCVALWGAIPFEVKNGWLKKTIRIALISSATTHHLQPYLEMFLGLKKLRCEFWTSDYQIDGIVHARDAALAAFRPDICVLQADIGDIRQWPPLACSEDDYRAVLDNEAARWIWFGSSLQDWLRCTVIQDSFVPPTYRPLGSLDGRVRGGHAKFVNELNGQMLRDLPQKMRWHDVTALTGVTGLRSWRDMRLWHHAKFAISPDTAPQYAFSLASMIATGYEATRKCLVLDLDNTLWGGVIGDDGHEGLVFGEGSGDGEAFKDFQSYVRQLKNQGVLLAVCSKNDDTVARTGFTKMAETVLNLNDFDSFVANWDRKSNNIAAIAHELNIGIESLVFFDDSPVEREEVRYAHPAVLVVEAPEDPAFYAAALDAYRAFEPASLTHEDLERSKFYKNQRAREAFAGSVSSYEDYLTSLEMRAEIRAFTRAEMPRIAQLINKTNQFNLTTRRYSEVDCERFLDADRYLSLYVRLKDRFGNYGLVSVFIGEIDFGRSRLEIDTWLMSCRVLKRGVEQALLRYVLGECDKLQLNTIEGVYRPSKSNSIVKSLYGDIGFTQVAENASGEVRWQLSTPYPLPATLIAFAD
jgi:FkbH-like protein